MSVLVGRFLLSFERSAAVKGQETVSSCAKAGVRSKGRPPILNGSSAKHGSVLKKRKVAKPEPSQSQRLKATSTPPADDGDNVADKKPHAEFVPDENESGSSQSAADKDSATENQQLDQAAQSTPSVICGCVSIIDRLTVSVLYCAPRLPPKV